MDFLLIVLTIGGLVFAAVMLVLASRAARMQRESDARVERLQALAVGSVLFASDAPVGPAAEAADSWSELADEEAPLTTPAVRLELPANAYPFVMTVPAGAGRIGGSFDRTSQRSRT
jgi:hypothetical protein